MTAAQSYQVRPPDVALLARYYGAGAAVRRGLGEMEQLMDLSEQKEMIAAVCQELGIQRLGVFGSATGPGFGAKSDIDVVVRFDRGPGQMFRRYFDLKEHLERIFNRPVDVVVEDSIRNPYFREAIERSRVSVYGP